MPTKRKTTRKARAPKAVATTPDTSLAPEAKPLDFQEELFVEQYFLCHMNGTEAALQSYNPSDRVNARRMASEVLRRPHVRAAVRARLNQFHMDADEVLARMAFHARGSIEDFINTDTGAIDTKKAKAAEAMGLIKKYKNRFTTTTRQIGTATEDIEISDVEIEMYDAQTALRDLGRVHKLFNDEAPVQRHEHLHLYVNGKPLSQQRTLTSGAMDAEIVDE